MKTRITELFSIKYPIIQGGMIWCSGWKLAAAVSNAGGLGLIGAGSMDTDLLREHIHKAKQATDKPFGVNLPLIYPHTEDMVSLLVDEKVKIVFTSAGNPKKYTPYFKKQGLRVVHVVPGSKFAQKAFEAGVDAIVAEGFEAGGHNGADETTSLVLLSQLLSGGNDIPIIAAGGFATGRAMLAALAMGADAVQIGSLFAASRESSAHPAFKEKIIQSGEGDTRLMLKKIVPVRLLKNHFSNQIASLQDNGASKEDLSVLLGRGRAKKGMFLGDINDGELEIGQVSSQINKIAGVEEIIHRLIDEFMEAKSVFIKRMEK